MSYYTACEGGEPIDGRCPVCGTPVVPDAIFGHVKEIVLKQPKWAWVASE